MANERGFFFAELKNMTNMAKIINMKNTYCLLIEYFDVMKDTGANMKKHEKYLNLIKTKDKMNEDEILEAANQLIASISEKKEISDLVVNSIDDIYDNELELIKIRAVEIALKLLDYSFYNADKTTGTKILDFLEEHIGSATENIQTSVIIHYSWAHRKFPLSKKMIGRYDSIMTKFNENKKFLGLFEEINHMEEMVPE